VNILSAIYSGQTGFLKSTKSIAMRADRLAKISFDPISREKASEDLLGLKLDEIQARSSLSTIRVSDQLLRRLSKIDE